jgi:NADH-quinone oxidoreductase subunit M
MLVAILGLYVLHGTATGTYTFAYETILDSMVSGAFVLSPTVEFWMFAAFFLAFAIKVPLFPLHTWLPDAHVEAPTAGSVLLAGVMLKMGTYGLARFNLTLFPAVSVISGPLIATLAIVGIVYGALVAMVQPDMKKLVAYSSVSHLGFVVLGIFGFTPMGVEGAVYQMLAHGVSTGALFLLVGVLYERRHTRLIADYGGVAHRMPVFAALFLLVTLSSIGLPGLNGFVGEILILVGTFGVNPVWAATAALGVILSAVYMLWMYQRAIFGEVRGENRNLEDLQWRELAMLLPMAALIVWMGVYSSSFLRPMDASVDRLIERVEASGELLARNDDVVAGVEPETGPPGRSSSEAAP